MYHIVSYIISHIISYHIIYYIILYIISFSKIFWTDFHKSLQYPVSRTFVPCQTCWCMRKDGKTGGRTWRR